MSQATAAQLPVLLHPPAFIPPGMLSALSGWQTTARGRGASGSDSLPGVTVTGKDCDKVITLFVFIATTSAAGTPEREKRKQALRSRGLLERAKQLLSRMGPWNCCKNGRQHCNVRLSLEILTSRVSGGRNPAPVVVHFYNTNEERVALMGALSSGNHRDTFGLWQASAGTPDRSPNDVGIIIAPSIGEWAGEQLPSSLGGLSGLDPGAVPRANYAEPHGGDVAVGSEPDPQGRPNRGIELRFAYDILSIIIHEIMHAMGAEHDDESGIANMMEEARNTGKSGAFKITAYTACEIAMRNGVCIGVERDKCCAEKTAHGGTHGKPRLASTTDGFVVPGMSVSGSVGKVARGGGSAKGATQAPHEGLGVPTGPFVYRPDP